MSLKLFTEEEIATLKTSRYVKLVTERTVHFTDEFKKIYKTRRQSGARPADILAELGIDAELLGKYRVNSLDARQLTPPKKASKPSASKQDSARLAKIEHELEYAKQELAFLKKLFREAQK